MTLPWLEKVPAKIVLVGDLILDEYIDGDVSRISPEAPVPVHLVKQISQTLGGAANTAKNIKLCGGNPLLIGATGCDVDGESLQKLAEESQIKTEGFLKKKGFQTIKKTRITSLRQQILRLDVDHKLTLTAVEERKILSAVKKEKPKVLVLSDYQKGLLSNTFLKSLISLARELKVKTIVDPKLKNFSAYENCSLITPNLKEALWALGFENLKSFGGSYEDICSQLRAKFNLQDILLTLGPGGMLYSKNTGEFFFEKAEKKEVYDVSGAGDTVVAIMALSFSCDLSPCEAVRLANCAAGIAVSKWRTEAVSWSEILEALGDKNHSLQLVRERGQKIVFTNGCFDLLHYGHVSYLEKAKALGDYLVVGLNTDASIRSLKGLSRPLNCLEHRKKVLESLRSVDLVIPFGEETPENLIKEVSPHVLVKGADYRKEEIVGYNYVSSYGGRVETISFVEELSSSSLISKIKGELSSFKESFDSPCVQAAAKIDHKDKHKKI